MSQIGDIREYTSIDESGSKLLAKCPVCQVESVPRGINSTRPGAAGEKHCLNCGAIYGRGPSIPVIKINVTGAGGAITIATLGGTLQMATEVLPAIATDKTVVWSVVPGTGTATIDTSGLLTAVTNGTVTVVATAHDGTGITGEIEITLSNQAS